MYNNIEIIVLYMHALFHKFSMLIVNATICGSTLGHYSTYNHAEP